MTDRTIELDQHRGMAAQKATELRRLMSEVEAVSPAAQDPRRQMLIARVLEDFIRLSADREGYTK